MTILARPGRHSLSRVPPPGASPLADPRGMLKRMPPLPRLPLWRLRLLGRALLRLAEAVGAVAAARPGAWRTAPQRPLRLPRLTTPQSRRRPSAELPLRQQHSLRTPSLPCTPFAGTRWTVLALAAARRQGHQSLLLLMSGALHWTGCCWERQKKRGGESIKTAQSLLLRATYLNRAAEAALIARPAAGTVAASKLPSQLQPRVTVLLKRPPLQPRMNPSIRALRTAPLPTRTRPRERRSPGLGDLSDARPEGGAPSVSSPVGHLSPSLRPRLTEGWGVPRRARSFFEEADDAGW